MTETQRGSPDDTTGETSSDASYCPPFSSRTSNNVPANVRRGLPGSGPIGRRLSKARWAITASGSTNPIRHV